MTGPAKDIILVIDDEADLREMVQYQFQAKGFEVVTAKNGAEGLNQLKKITPDLIILDMNMPKMGGIEFYQAICDENLHPKYPVLVLTARANLEHLFKSFDIHGFMSKPFEVEELIRQGTMIIKKMKRVFVKDEGRDLSKPRTICVVENDAEISKNISSTLSEAGYIISSARNGTSAIEGMVASPPDVALIKLGLEDISGDIVAFRLKRMSITSEVKIILYLPKTDELNADIVHHIGEKGKVATIVKYTGYGELIEAIDKVLKI